MLPLPGSAKVAVAVSTKTTVQINALSIVASFDEANEHRRSAVVFLDADN